MSGMKTLSCLINILRKPDCCVRLEIAELNFLELICRPSIQPFVIRIKMSEMKKLPKLALKLKISEQCI